MDNIDGGVSLDLGAHVGIFSLKVAETTECLVHAYEPHSKNFNELLYNIRLNDFSDRITAYEEAIWDSDGIGELSLDPYIDNIFWKSSDSHSMYKMDKWKKVPVKTVSPKTIFKRVGDSRISYLKINCEGAEYYIMKYLVDNDDILYQVDRLCVEIHPDMLKPEWREEFPEIMDVVSDMNIPYKVMFASIFCKSLDDKLGSLKVDNL